MEAAFAEELGRGQGAASFPLLRPVPELQVAPPQRQVSILLVLRPERMQPLSEYACSLKPSLMASLIARAFLELDIPQARACGCRPLGLPDPCILDNPTR